MTRTELEMEFAGAALGWVERELEMTDPEISRTLGVDRKTIYRWRKRESAPAPEQRKRLAKLTQLKWFLEKTFERLPKANAGSTNQFRADIARLEGYDAILSPSAALDVGRNLNLYIDGRADHLRLMDGPDRIPLNYQP